MTKSSCLVEIRKISQLYGNHPHAELIEIDITDDSALETLVADLYLRYGKIDVLNKQRWLRE